MVDPFYTAVRLIARFWIWFFFERVERLAQRMLAYYGALAAY